MPYTGPKLNLFQVFFFLLSYSFGFVVKKKNDFTSLRCNHSVMISENKLEFVSGTWWTIGLLESEFWAECTASFKNKWFLTNAKALSNWKVMITLVKWVQPTNSSFINERTSLIVIPKENRDCVIITNFWATYFFVFVILLSRFYKYWT